MQKHRPSDDEIGIPVLKIKELRQGCCDESSEICSPNIKSEYIIHDGDVIFSWSGSLLVDFWCGCTCGLNQHLFKVTSKKYDKWLDSHQLISRTHGGAVFIPEAKNSQKTSKRNHTKHLLAEYAASLVEENDTIFINTSSTALEIIRYIHGKNITIVTNNASAVCIDHDPCIQIILSGGELRRPKFSLTGDFAMDTINQIHADKCFVGCSGLSIDCGLTTAVHSESSINRAMVERCYGLVYVLADYTKIGKRSNFFFAPLSSIDYLITGSEAKTKDLEDLSREGITCIRLGDGAPTFFSSKTSEGDEK